MSRPKQNDAIGHGFAARTPQRRIAVAFAQHSLIDKRLVSVHAHVGVNVVALGLADKRIQARPGVVARAEQSFQTVNQGVLVCAVQGIAGLKGHDPLPAFFGQQFADLDRRKHVLAEHRMLGLRQDLDRAAQEVRFVGVALEHHVPARMIGPLGEIHAAEVTHFVPGKNVGDIQNGHDSGRRNSPARPFGPASVFWPSRPSPAARAGWSRRISGRCVRSPIRPARGCTRPNPWARSKGLSPRRRNDTRSIDRRRRRAPRSSVLARARKSGISSAGTVRQTGSVNPPCGGTRGAHRNFLCRVHSFQFSVFSLRFTVNRNQFSLPSLNSV